MGYAADLSSIGEGQSLADERNRVGRAAVLGRPETSGSYIDNPRGSRYGETYGSASPGGAQQVIPVGISAAAPDADPQQAPQMTEEEATQAVPLIASVMESARKNLSSENPSKKSIDSFSKNAMDAVYNALSIDKNPNHPLAAAVLNASGYGGFKSIAQVRQENIDGKNYWRMFDASGQEVKNAPMLAERAPTKDVSGAEKETLKHYKDKFGGIGMDGESPAPSSEAALASAYQRQGYGVAQSFDKVADDLAQLRAWHGDTATGESLANGLRNITEKLMNPKPMDMPSSQPQPRGGISIPGVLTQDGSPLDVQFGRPRATSGRQRGDTLLDALKGQAQPPAQLPAPEIVPQPPPSAPQGLPQVPVPAGIQAPLPAAAAAEPQAAPTGIIPVPEAVPSTAASDLFRDMQPEPMTTDTRSLERLWKPVSDYFGGIGEQMTKSRASVADFNTKWASNNVKIDDIKMGLSVIQYLDPDKQRWLQEQARKYGISLPS